MCDNKEDLKWCKAASMWTVPDNWIPMNSYVPGEKGGIPQMKCTFHNDTDPRGQWYNPENYFDGKIFQCINRADEDPFSKQKNTTDRWLELVNSSCVETGAGTIGWRRCLGDKPTLCVGK